MKNCLTLVVFLVCLWCRCKAEDELLSVVEIFRHGDRTPAFFYPTDPYQDRKYWNDLEAGELTEKGSQQLYNLGQQFKDRYSYFLGNAYNPEEIIVTSSHMSRTKNSAKSFMTGLYGGIEIPIKTETAVANEIIICLKFDALYKKSELTDPEIIDINENNKELYEYLSNNTKLPIGGMFTASGLFDTLTIEQDANLNMPEWTNSVMGETLRQVRQNAAKFFCYTKEQQKLGIGSLINRIIEHFDKIIEGKKEAKALIFSLHDLNILCFLQAFQYPEISQPAFASSVFFELRKSKTNGRYFVNTFYKPTVEQPPISIAVAGCDVDCDLDNFKNIFREFRLSSGQWYSECYAFGVFDKLFPTKGR
ncbi:testicular acid phosphatase homolog [Diabrotica undecimpunctata]|uniref:testicular acid phosphatase homolog n=1 Tax=Diabrotica undecimpunctata TaxID=50387 RepID=UPI003B63A21B